MKMSALSIPGLVSNALYLLAAALAFAAPATAGGGSDRVEIGPGQEWLVRRILQSDFLFWSLLNSVPDQLIETLLATDPALFSKGAVEERERDYRILRDLMPINRRSRGMLKDAELAGRPARMDFARLAVPLLIISVEDDRFGITATARDIAAAVPGARLKIFPQRRAYLAGT